MITSYTLLRVGSWQYVSYIRVLYKYTVTWCMSYVWYLQLLI